MTRTSAIVLPTNSIWTSATLVLCRKGAECYLFAFKISFRIYNSHNHTIRETFFRHRTRQQQYFWKFTDLFNGNGEKEPYLAVISGHSPLAENKNGGQNPSQADDNITKIKILILGIKAGGKIF